MKVLIVTIEPFPNGMAAVSRIKCYAKALQSAGVNVEVFVSVRTEHHDKVVKNHCGIGIWEGIPYRYAGGTPLRAKNIFVRKCGDIRDRILTLRYIKRNLNNGDAVMCYMRERNFAFQVAKVCHSIGIPCLRDLCEYPFITEEQTVDVEKKRMNYMRNIFPCFDGIIAISQSLFEYAQLHKRQDAKTIKIPIMVNCEGSVMSKQSSPVPFFFHSGTMLEQKDGILGVIEAFGKAKQKYSFPIKYYFTGKLEQSADVTRIKELIHQYDLKDSLKFLGYLQDNEMKQYQADCVAMIINKHDNLQNRYCFATKLGEYLLSARPVITSKIGEAVNYLIDRENAFLYDDNDIEGLSELMIYALSHESECNIVGKNGRKLALECFDYRIYGRVLRNFIDDIAKDISHY